MTNSVLTKRQTATHLHECVVRDDGLGCAGVLRTGAVIGEWVEQFLSIPSFAAMSARMSRSTEAAGSMVHFPCPGSVSAESDEGGIITMGVGRDALTTVIINKSPDIESLKNELAVTANDIGEE